MTRPRRGRCQLAAVARLTSSSGVSRGTHLGAGRARPPARSPPASADQAEPATSGTPELSRAPMRRAGSRALSDRRTAPGTGTSVPGRPEPAGARATVRSPVRVNGSCRCAGALSPIQRRSASSCRRRSDRSTLRSHRSARTSTHPVGQRCRRMRPTLLGP